MKKLLFRGLLVKEIRQECKFVIMIILKLYEVTIRENDINYFRNIDNYVEERKKLKYHDCG